MLLAVTPTSYFVYTVLVILLFYVHHNHLRIVSEKYFVSYVKPISLRLFYDLTESGFTDFISVMVRSGIETYSSTEK